MTSAASPNVHYDHTTNEFVRDSKVTSLLPQVMWHVTDVCPLACPYCFATKTALSFDVSQTERVLSVLSDLGVQKVDLAGGEPLTWMPLASLATQIRQQGIAITLTTSGIGHPANRRWLLSNASEFARIMVSLDAPDRRSHDTLRSFPGAFEAANDFLNRLHASGFSNVRINTVITRTLVENGDLDAFARLIVGLAPREWCLIQPHPANEKATFRETAPSADQFVAFVDSIRQALSSSRGSPRLLVRTTRDYTGYWVLYPDGMLRQHTDGADDRAATSILTTPIDTLRAHVMRFGVSLPGIV